MLNPYNFQIPQSTNILGFDSYKDVLAALKKNRKVGLRGQVNTDPKVWSNQESVAGPDPDPDPAYSSNAIPNSRPDFDFSLTSSPNPNILLNFYNSDSGSDRRGKKDILLHFDSDSGVDEGLDDSEEESESCVHSGGMLRKPGGKYTQFDFDFLDEEWLELTDESSNPPSSCSSSMDR